MHQKPDLPHRVVIESVEPSVDGGRYPVKRTPGERVDVTADIFVDGHDMLRAVLRYRAVEADRKAGGWHEAPMAAGVNDQWLGSFVVDREGVYEFAIDGWVDRFGSWRRDLQKKFDAGQEVGSELLEGAMLVRAAAERGKPKAAAKGKSGKKGRAEAGEVEAPGDDRGWLLAQADRLAGDAPMAARVAAAMEPRLEALVLQHADRLAVTTTPMLRVHVERERARYGAWYEMFPRSAGPDATRSATFDEAAGDLPRIAAMGFDVLYLPPIHPIGRTFRKGPNNTLGAGPNDPGSPWAIGSEEGGHDAVEPGLGTIDDFKRFMARARELGLEVAIDLAFQCAPDHPYVKSHPEWFRHRPDGTIKYAENPPKKYQDIYPFDFECAEWHALWDELKRVVLFWAGHGVRIFRVDNPHTKPFRFWEWLIAHVRREYPDVLYLSEAFTRPKVMRHLAKIGFTQSYTYFTWRNTKAELTEYFTELTQTPVREYMRPNLFANTPDILHEYLQRGGRPAFETRLILAATLGATYGIYSGYELCENRPVRPGSEEYLDSEKYQIRKRDWTQPGSIAPLVTAINQVRRENPALHGDWSLRFHHCENDQILCYSKSTDDGTNRVLVAVNLDPFHMQHGWIHVPVAAWGLKAEGYVAEDLISGERYFWHGEWNYVRLDPGYRAGHVLRIGNREDTR
jgi:starch synthase (maltosyl-transferring)